MNDKITFQQLAELLSSSTGGSTSTTELFIKELFAIVGKALINGEKVQIKGIGTFMPSMDNSTIEFAPDADLAVSINLPFSCFEAIELDDEMHQALISDETQPKQESEIDETIEVAEPAVIETDEEPIEDGVEWAESTTEKDTEPTHEEASKIQLEEDIADIQTSNVAEIDVDYNTVEQPEVVVEPVEETLETETTHNQQIPDPILDTTETVTEDKHKKSKFAFGIIIGILIGAVIGAMAMFVIGNKLLPSQTNMPNSESEEIIDESVCIAVDTLATDTLKIEPVYENIAVDTVKQTRFLTTMARQYYNQMLYWVYIYEENKEKLGNPNVIKPGTTVVIPDIRKYLKSDTDSVNIEHAKLKAVEIYAPYQK